MLWSELLNARRSWMICECPSIVSVYHCHKGMNFVRSVTSPDKKEPLQMRQHTLGTAVRYRPAGGVPLGVRDLPVIDDNGVPLRPVAVHPADTLAELYPVVRGEDLVSGGDIISVKPFYQCVFPRVETAGRELTMKSSFTPLALPHALMTQWSLEAMKTTWSTPLALSWSLFLMYETTCCSWHVGVKAPGTATMTIFLSLASVLLPNVS